MNEPALHALHPFLERLEPSYVPGKLLLGGAPSVPTAAQPTVPLSAQLALWLLRGIAP